jgi:hypothetical protein
MKFLPPFSSHYIPPFHRNHFRSIIVMMMLCAVGLPSWAQLQPSPATWLYPLGNPEATRRQVNGSDARQDFISVEKRYTADPTEVELVPVLDTTKFGIKWSSSDISDNATVLVGNIVNNARLRSDYVYQPLEAVALSGNDIVVLDAEGKILSKTPLSNFGGDWQQINDISVLIQNLRKI